MRGSDLSQMETGVSTGVSTGASTGVSTGASTGAQFDPLNETTALALFRPQKMRTLGGWTGALLSCFAAVDDDSHKDNSYDDYQDTDPHHAHQFNTVSFFEEPVTFALLASTHAIMTTVASWTAGITSFFTGPAVTGNHAQDATLFEVVIDGEASFESPATVISATEMSTTESTVVESPKFTRIADRNPSVDVLKTETVSTAPACETSSFVPDAPIVHLESACPASASISDEDVGFWEQRDEDEVSECDSFYALESYIDKSADAEIKAHPIARTRPLRPTVKVHFEPIVELMNCAVINDRAKIKERLQSGQLDVNIHDQIGYTLLHYAAAHGHLDLVSYLLERGADVNRLEPDGWSALHFSAIADHFKVCKLLVAHGASVECPNDSGHMPINLTRDPKTVRLLTEAAKRKHTAKKVRALYDWTATAEDELSIRKGQQLKVCRRDPDWWLLQDDSKRTGLVPRLFVQ